MSEKIKYVREEPLVDKQNRRQREILETFEAGNYTFDSPMVVTNPYFINPLAALVLFTTEKETAITVSVIGKDAATTISHTYPKGTRHILPVLGLYQDCENTVELGIYQGRSRQFTIKTDKLHNGAECLKMDTTPDYLQDDLMFVTPVISGLATAYDCNGDIRWHITIPTMFNLARMKNGNLTTGSHRLMQAPYFVSGLYEMDMLGKIHTEYRVPGGYHHDHIEMSDGNLVILSDDLLSDTVEDICHLVDRKTGEVVKSWDFKTEIRPEEAPPSINYSLHDWFHCNAVGYNENTDTLTLSGRHCDAVINIDYATGKLNWIIGDPEGWPAKYRDYFFTPAGDGEFDWQYEQHAVVLTPDGDIMCFDNGHGRSKIPEKRRKNRDNFSRGVRYKINTGDMTIRQVWQYGKERGSEFFSQYICNVDYYGEGNYLIHSGGVGYHDGQTAEFMVAFDPGDPKNEQRSITVEVLNGKPVFEMQLKGNFYRARKMKLYHDGENTSLAEGRIVGSMQPTKQRPAIAADGDGAVPAKYNALLIEENDRIVFKGTFEQNQEAALSLHGTGETRQYAIPTAKLNATMAGSFLKEKDDPTNTWVSVNKEGLAGAYDVCLVADGKRYKTGISITV